LPAEALLQAVIVVPIPHFILLTKGQRQHEG
jgi:hypothetical protein